MKDKTVTLTGPLPNAPEGTYKVSRTKNTLRVKGGQLLNEAQVAHLIQDRELQVIINAHKGNWRP